MNSLSWHPVLRFPVEKDLSPLLQDLKVQGVLHHVTEEDGQQQLWITDESKILEIAEYASRWVSGEIVFDTAPLQEPSLPKVNKTLVVFQLVRILPVSLCTIFLGYIGALLVFADSETLSYAEPFLFQAIQEGYWIPANESIGSGQYWRLLTPIFLHFGILHILFNSIVLWDVGRRIEVVQGSKHYLLFIIVVGLTSNIAQHFVQANIPFGGLSGVVYGAIGYVAVYQHYIQHPILQFNKAAIIFFIAWLFLGVFGIIDFFIDGSVANAAHIAGLISGAIIGRFAVYSDRNKTKKS